MRTTVRLDDNLLKELKRRALKEGVSLTQLMNRVVRCGLAAARQGLDRPKRRFRQKTHDLGEAKFPIEKALSFAAQLEDEETMQKFMQGK